jgi:hypothetical protein
MTRTHSYPSQAHSPAELCATLPMHFISSHGTSYQQPSAALRRRHTDSQAEKTLEPSRAHGRRLGAATFPPVDTVHRTASLGTRTLVGGGVQTQASLSEFVEADASSLPLRAHMHDDPVSNDLVGSTNRLASSVTAKATAGSTANQTTSDLSPT